MFTDRVTLELTAGKGGNGIVAWRREKYIPKGGPTGGDGGNGGTVVLEVDSNLPSLDPFQSRRHLKAENGRQGGPNRRHGKRGRDLILKVPPGTLIKEAQTGHLLRDMVTDKERFAICQGGRGGRGNASFTTPTNRAPHFATEGKEGEKIAVELELKLIADVGLVGYPNAGKSTLLTALAHTPAKAAPYPFTTLHPNIGYIELPDYRRITLADIPGVIENAHQNRGLGLQFLRHIERTKLLLFVLDISGIDGRSAIEDYRILQKELKAYNPELLQRPSFVLLNKCDLPSASEEVAAFYQMFPELKKKALEISALTETGIAALLNAICGHFVNLREERT